MDFMSRRLPSLAISFALLISGRAFATPKDALKTTLFVAAQASLLLDAMQTWDIKNSQCQNGPGTCGTARTELNPLLGPHPSDAAVLAYFGGISLLQTALYLWGPTWMSMGTSGVTLVVEVPQVARNVHVGAHLSLPF
jgi:hypothetical protein